MIQKCICWISNPCEVLLWCGSYVVMSWVIIELPPHPPRGIPFEVCSNNFGCICRPTTSIKQCSLSVGGPIILVAFVVDRYWWKRLAKVKNPLHVSLPSVLVRLKRLLIADNRVAIEMCASSLSCSQEKGCMIGFTTNISKNGLNMVWEFLEKKRKKKEYAPPPPPPPR